MKALGGRLYRPDVAPAEVGEGEALGPEGDDGAAEPQPAPTLKLTLNNPLFEAVPPKNK